MQHQASELGSQRGTFSGAHIAITGQTDSLVDGTVQTRVSCSGTVLRQAYLTLTSSAKTLPGSPVLRRYHVVRAAPCWEYFVSFLNSSLIHLCQEL